MHHSLYVLQCIVKTHLRKNSQNRVQNFTHKCKCLFFNLEMYKRNGEPISQAGTQMGLSVMLDAHTDILTEFSVTDDFQGFTAIVTSPSDFPLIYQQGFGIKTGKIFDRGY